jgi:excisionase family DNA binding protein
MDSLLTVHDVAELLTIHHKKVQRLARTGVIPCIKIGAVYRFRREALEAWIGRKETK